ncbi:hypothetical protein N7495_006410 [Penicillium taxi]|uniref:uncharacterized protein n=1 Tax=Penicillium taxi TaxID=168475 RepID=UPI0025450E46|nr:uncharacterized protein N7495_006410 [Penicillium taxi]KAJ5894719.1 hypothetical protein N7495_006410 [Penicillium taxi]
MDPDLILSLIAPNSGRRTPRELAMHRAIAANIVDWTRRYHESHQFPVADSSTDEKDQIGIEGAVKYYNDLGVKLDEIVCVAVAEICKCPAMGEFTRNEFIAGWKTAKYITTPPCLKFT